MRRRLVLALGMVAGIAGCGTPSRIYEPDHRQIEAIERAALYNGVTLKWIHPPMRSRPAGERPAGARPAGN